jgi:four helix bundle protein
MSGARAKVESYRDLIVWQKSMDLAVAGYQITKRFPVEERYGLTSQIRRAGTSVPANIAEGYGRESPGSYAQQLRIAQGSLKEFETHLLLAQRIELATTLEISPAMGLPEEVGKMLRALIRSLER